MVFDKFEGNLVTSYLADIDGSNPKKIFNGFGWDHSGEKWSPDGKMIAIQSSNSDGSVCDGSMKCTSLYILKIGDLPSLKEVYTHVQNDSLQWITWSPDSQWILVPIVQGGASLINMTNYQFIQTRIPAWAYWPVNWSPESKFIAYITTLGCEDSINEKNGIGIYGLDESEQIIELPCDYFYFDDYHSLLWTLNGSGFIIYHSPTKSLVLLGKDGKIQKEIVVINGRFDNTKLSYDGKWILYVEETSLRAVKLDGTGNRVLVYDIKSDYTLVKAD